MLAGLLRKGQGSKAPISVEQESGLNNVRHGNVLDSQFVSNDMNNTGKYKAGQYPSTSSMNGNSTKAISSNHPNFNSVDTLSDTMKAKLFGTANFDYETEDVSGYSQQREIKDVDQNKNSILNPVMQNKTVLDSFRIIIAEETGQMASRNNHRLIIDTTFPKGLSMSHIRAGELKEYIFGSPLRLSESTKSDKFRTIPNSNMTLITRTFNYSSSMSNRLAICLCVPRAYFPIITEGWFEVSQWLDYSQATIISMVKKNKQQRHSQSILQSNNNNFNSVNLENSVAGVLSSKLNNTTMTDNDTLSYLLSSDRVKFLPDIEKIIQKLQKTVIPHLKSLHDIPRLFLFPEESMLYIDAWFQEIFSWIEIKDGPNSPFLPSLLAKVILNYKDTMVGDISNRIVVISGNVVVADKLIFIIAGLLEPKALKSCFSDISSSTVISKMNSSSTLPDTETLNEKTASLSLNGNSTSDFEGMSNFCTDLNGNTITKNYERRSISTNNNDIGSPSNSDKIYSSKRGWEIPKKKGSQDITKTSSGESLAQVIQPSSLNSGGSLTQLHASLSSSQSGSYGSWFKQMPSLSHIMQSSNSIKSTDSWDRPISSTQGLHRTSSNSSFHQLRSAFGMTPQPSPSISEYEEYPWFGTPPSSKIDTSIISTTNAVAQPIISKPGNMYGNFPTVSNTSNIGLTTATNTTNAADTSSISSSNPFNSSNNFYSNIPSSWPLQGTQEISNFQEERFNLKRNNRNFSKQDKLDDAFERICNSMNVDNLDYSLTPRDERFAGTVEVKMTVLGEDETKDFNRCSELLPRYTTFLNSYNSWFNLQAFQFNSESKYKIVESMRKDIQTQATQSTEITLMVILSSREIQEVSMKKENNKLMQKNKTFFSNGKINKFSINNEIPASSLPSKSTNNHNHQPISKHSDNGNELLNCVTFIEYAIKTANDLYNDKHISKDTRNKEILKLYLGLLHYK